MNDIDCNNVGTLVLSQGISFEFVPLWSIGTFVMLTKSMGRLDAPFINPFYLCLLLSFECNLDFYTLQ